LKGYLRQRGFSATVRDLNIEGLHFLVSGKNREKLRALLRERFAELNRKTTLHRAAEMEYWRLAEAMDCFHDFESALAGMMDGRLFFRKDLYQRNRNALEDLFTILAAVYFPFRFGFNQADHLIAPWDFDLLDFYISRRLSPFAEFYENILKDFSPVGLIGISLTFVSQIPETFYLCRLIRQRMPERFIMLGGGCIDQIMRHGRPAARDRILDYADAVVLQEGEKAIEMLAAQGKTHSAQELAAIPNLVCKDLKNGTVIHGPEWVLDLGKSAPPDYTDLQLDRYMAPAPMLLYSPSRGCYWNKCSFCSYGFNQSGRHGYREVPAGQAVADLLALQALHGVDNFYLSCDVLAPGYTVELAEKIIASGLRINWSTDLRVEAAYTPAKCRLLYEAGLRSVALGVESGCERMLKIMDKGTSPERIREVSRNFHQAGIAVAWMTFLNHPGEKEADALATLNLLAALRDTVDQFIVGDFSLMPGSLLAGNPGRYGIISVYYTAGDVFGQFPLHVMRQEESCGTGNPAAGSVVDQMLASLSGRYHLDHYPWAGSISTHHSFLYILRFGPRVFAQCWQGGRKRRMSAAKRDRGPILRHNVHELQKREERFRCEYLRNALRRDKRSNFAPLSYAHFEKALREGGPCRKS